MPTVQGKNRVMKFILVLYLLWNCLYNAQWIDYLIRRQWKHYKYNGKRLTSMATFCLAIAFSTSPYMMVLWIPRPQKMLKACNKKELHSRSWYKSNGDSLPHELTSKSCSSLSSNGWPFSLLIIFATPVSKKMRCQTWRNPIRNSIE